MVLNVHRNHRDYQGREFNPFACLKGYNRLVQILFKTFLKDELSYSVNFNLSPFLSGGGGEWGGRGGGAGLLFFGVGVFFWSFFFSFLFFFFSVVFVVENLHN